MLQNLALALLILAYPVPPVFGGDREDGCPDGRDGFRSVQTSQVRHAAKRQ